MTEERRPPAHGSVEGLERPPRGKPGDYPVPMPGTDRHLATPVPPVHVPRHGAPVWIRSDHGWAAALAQRVDTAGRRMWCTWTADGQVGTAVVSGWVAWDDVRRVAGPGVTWPATVTPRT